MVPNEGLELVFERSVLFAVSLVVETFWQLLAQACLRYDKQRKQDVGCIMFDVCHWRFILRVVR